MRRNPEGELDSSRAGGKRTIVPRSPGTAWPQGEQRGADLKADPVLAVVSERKAHHVEIELLGFLHLRTQQNGVVEIADVTETHAAATLRKIDLK